MTLQTKNLIGRVGKNNRAEHGARAARPLERVVLFMTTTWSNQICGFDDNAKRTNNTSTVTSNSVSTSPLVAFFYQQYRIRTKWNNLAKTE